MFPHWHANSSQIQSLSLCFWSCVYRVFRFRSGGVRWGSRPDLYSSTSAFANSIRHSSTRWVNHGYQANETEILHWEVHFICVKLETFRELFVWQGQVAKSCNNANQIQMTCQAAILGELVLSLAI